MWTWLGRGDPRVLGGATVALVLVILVIGRLRRFRRRRNRDGLRSVELWRHKPIAGAVLQWMALALLVAGAAGAALLWLLGFPSFPSAAAFGTTEVLELLKIALAVVAGLGGVVLLAVNMRKQRVAESEHLIAQAKDEREQAQSFNERFGTAAEQLAHDNAAVRLAGLYAMAGLADDWVANRQICVDVLCGYLRLPVRENDQPDAKVRESVLRVLRDRLNDNWRGSALELDLTGARFSNQTVLQLAPQRRLLLDHALFEDGVFTVGPMNAYAVSYTGATFRGSETRFEWGGIFTAAHFAGRLVFDTDRTWRRFRFIECVFAEATIVIKGEGERISLVTFEGCTFEGCLFDFKGVVDLGEGEGNFLISSSTLRDGKFDLRKGSVTGTVLWLIDSKLENMTFTVDSEAESRSAKSITLVNVTAVGTELPDSHVFHRDQT
ncbi:hypothetical protein ACFQ05_11295 [Amycolatopsis umgeniensis]|uniref:Pentapeptide repeat-containing protein n=1 Tax=Amycolatopsis umgeniensis TaxID=336628 RepID=A0A841B4G3_9PSEU|nr:hypothetical protein [Amycolatopsis umgeniensis]MBB5853883.1 hypothetical protein [Amycolatopsis umgeniensis]